MKKAFTLLEILIGTAIFAAVMVLTTGIVAQSAGYQTKIKEMRRVLQIQKSLSESLSTDIQQASLPFTVKLNSDPAPDGGIEVGEYQYKNGVGIFKAVPNFSYTVRTHHFLTSPIALSEPSDPNDIFTEIPDSNLVLIFSKNVSGIAKYKIYYHYYENDGYEVYYKEGDAFLSANGFYAFNSKADPDTADPDRTLASILDEMKAVTATYRIAGDDNTDVKLYFAGYAPDQAAIVADSQNKQQANIIYNIRTSTKDFDNKSVLERARTEIKTTITPRSYNF